MNASFNPGIVVGLGAVAVALTLISQAVGQEEGRRRESGEGQSPRRGEGEARRPAEGQRGREAQDRLRGFRPQTEREAALYRMLQQLQREVVGLRREVQAMRDRGDTPAKDAPRTFALPDRWQTTKEGRVFTTYDKNGDQVVTLEEWLAMTNGNVSAARRALQTKRFQEAEPSGDGRFTPAEFIYWYGKGRFENTERRTSRDGDRPPSPERRRDGDRPPSPERKRDGDRN